MKGMMPSHYRKLMDMPDCGTDTCVVCGRLATNRHHVVPRSLGGHDGPTVALCGSGTTGCHGLAELKRLHFRFVKDKLIEIEPNTESWTTYGWWEFLITPEPVSYWEALKMDGWLRCRE